LVQTHDMQPKQTHAILVIGDRTNKQEWER